MLVQSKRVTVAPTVPNRAHTGPGYCWKELRGLDILAVHIQDMIEHVLVRRRDADGYEEGSGFCVVVAETAGLMGWDGMFGEEGSTGIRVSYSSFCFSVSLLYADRLG